MNHGVGIVDAHTIGTGMFTHDIHDAVVSLFAGPVTLPLQNDLLPVTGTMPA